MKQKRSIYLFAAVVILCIITLAVLNKYIFVKTQTQNQKLDNLSGEQVIGIFDRSNSIRNLNSTAIQHFSLQLEKGFDAQSIENLIEENASYKQFIITVEIHGSPSSNVLEDVIKGDYDKEITTLCKAVSREEKTVFFRWNPDMEVPVKLYPWQYQSPKTYIEAFNYFAKLCKKSNPSIKIIWGAAGYPGAEEYWPGPSLVDYISVTINGKSESTATAFPQETNMETAIRRKIIRMRFMDKPILILGSAKSKKNEEVLKQQLANAILNIDKEKETIYGNLPGPISPETLQNQRNSEVIKGVYDPKLLLTNSHFVKAEHIFIDLGNVQDGSFARDFKSIIARKHSPIITVEPWRDHKTRKDTNVLLNTVNGIYDNEFSEIFKVISSTNQTVYLRFSHEMEIPIHRYAWQSQDPALYIRAFRHFMSLDKLKAKNIRKVWGPAGDRGSIEFWPGNDVVDYISIAIYGLPDKNITDVNQQESFTNIFSRKHYRMRFIDKPFFITEFGVKGPEEYQQRWMSDAANTINAQKDVHGVCYFNLADNPKVWGKIPPPDWSISKTTFEKFSRDIKRN